MTRGAGRFAPSPTGDLHFGSLVAAVGSFLQARSRGDAWLIRIEDIDPPREVPGSAQRILDDLKRLGLRPDAAVVYQSQRSAAYESALDRLLGDGLAYWCGCSRRDLPEDGVYPGTCRKGLAAGRQARSIRVRVPRDEIIFRDRLLGLRRADLGTECGDFVIWRADGLPAYQLAVVVDDAWQGITEVVRGQDLLSSTPRQVHLQRLLDLPTPSYLHLPLVLDGAGRKLSKQLGSDPISTLPPLECLSAVLRFLGQRDVDADALPDFWAGATEQWDPGRVPLPVRADSDPGV